MRTRVVVIAVAAVTLAIGAAACSKGGGGGGGPGSAALGGYEAGSFATTADALTFATGASAAQVLTISYLPLGLIGFDPACPHVQTNGQSATITGGCTDQSGNTYSGTILENGGFTGESIDFQQWKVATVESCASGAVNTDSTWDGKFDLTVAGQNAANFHSDLTVHLAGVTADTSCQPAVADIAIAYSGETQNVGPDNNGDGTPDQNQFDGAGDVGILSGASAATETGGKVHATTTAELVDQNTCQYEALSGSTKIDAGGHEAVFTYDGAATCDTSATVTWTYDGTNMGELKGVSCDVGGLDGAPQAWAAMSGALAFALAWRRRRAR